MSFFGTCLLLLCGFDAPADAVCRDHARRVGHVEACCQQVVHSTDGLGHLPRIAAGCVPGTVDPRTCRAATGIAQVCNARCGNNGWLGIVGISITGGEHITKVNTKMNDTYFDTAITTPRVAQPFRGHLRESRRRVDRPTIAQ